MLSVVSASLVRLTPLLTATTTATATATMAVPIQIQIQNQLRSHLSTSATSLTASASASVAAAGPPATPTPPLDYASYLSPASRVRRESAIRALMPFVKQPGMISLGGGMPNPATFPFKGMSYTLADGSTIHLTPEETSASLQYSATPGLPELVSALKQMQVEYHYGDRKLRVPSSLSVTVGSQDGLGKCFEMLLGPGDTLLLENPTYSGSLSALQPLSVKLHGLATDAFGLIPASLDSALTNWNEATQGRRPRVLYTIPTGSNPSGGSQTLERKHRIYDICRRPENNIVIIEDDPYYFLQFTSPRVPSYLSFDIDDRVLRFDSLSKVLSAGMRLGYVTGPTPLVERIDLHSQATNLHASGSSQALAASLLKTWKTQMPKPEFLAGDTSAPYDSGLDLVKLSIPGFELHARHVAQFYRTQRDAFLAAANRHLKGLAEWNEPTAGMFVWFKLNGIADTRDLILRQAVQKNVLLVPGNAFVPGGGQSSYVRASYSVATPEQMDTALGRLAALLKDVQKQ
ncbi:aminoadipate aminotransferase [Capsaspora owczarzaki ATCC 30864]|nr:aminoadipate aminotransferase [Capsaspora owczarzaki ATCC 30864]|eukprot:XP_004346830.1 aminoadipate aminotransferase [Capsaspora owczarzaki ATCC 30864]